MKQKFSGLLLAMFVGFTSNAIQAQDQPVASVDGIAAVVDEDVILNSEVERAVQNIKAQYAKQPGQLPPEDVLRKQVLERLVLLRLQVERAKNSGVRISDNEINQAIQNIANQNKLTLDQLRTQITSEGLSYEEFRNNLKDEITVQRMRQSYVQSRVQVSDTEIDQLLSVREVGGPEIRLANILVALPDGATPEQLAKAQEKISGIKALIDKGEMDFSSAAIRFSDSQNALEGGEIGWRTVDSIPPAFVNMIRSMKPGDVTNPVRGPSGYQLIKLIETREQQKQMATQYHALGMMIPVKPGESSEAARQKAEDLRARIVAGEDFGKLAKENSTEEMNASKGGDMGWFELSQWGQGIASKLEALKDGEVSDVFLSDVGWHFVKRLGTRTQDMTDENRRNQARQIIAQRKSEEEYERFLRQLRNDAYIESRIGGS
ncbi:MAG TPA: peptidylprolyl isomerase [Arenimonas sp.]|nr:peptidylprolyl isomerase [Arenimonas sp.]HOZ05371.1 peptidylprolyl isomerase [Arenimonas sp.]HPW31502.1 peptidylprolyl isomerase [Arenimonas sp.]